MTPAAALELAQELRNYVRTIRADWPSLTERQEDLAAHIRAAEMLHRVKRHSAR